MKIKQGVIIQKIEDEYILIDSGIVEPYFHGMIKLNEMGKEIITLLQEKELSEEEIIKILESKYDAKEGEISSSVNSFIKELSKTPILIR